LIAPIAARLHYLLPALTSSDATLHLNTVVINTQVELLWAIVAATIPCLRPFMTATHTTWGGGIVDTDYGSAYYQRSHRTRSKTAYNGGKPTSSTPKRKRSNHANAETSQDEIALRPMPHTRQGSHAGWEEVSVALGTAGPGDLGEGRPGRSSRVHVGADDEEDARISREARSQADQQSLSSQDSQRMIIRQDREWTVTYEDRGRTNDPVGPQR